MAAMKNTQQSGAPHRAIPAQDARERFTLDLFDTLWAQYRQRVSYVRMYEDVVRQAGATFVNDHIAFRTIATQLPSAGAISISRVMEPLGYQAASLYQFPDQHLNAVHYQHPNPSFPKLFVSELKTWEMGPEVRDIIHRTMVNHRPPLSEETLASLASFGDNDAARRDQLMTTLVNYFQQLPWPLPERRDVEAVNRASQYAAWVLVHGYNVNHFTSSINSHGVEGLNDIEKTIGALKRAGVPMKAEIEGARGTKLRQTATEAVVIDVPIRDGGHDARMPWSYAYFELAERSLVTDPDTGKQVRFEGFLGPQATHLFDMTKMKQ